VGVDPSRERAERAVEAVWLQGVRFVVIDAPPTRAGRGRGASPPKGRRPASRREQGRCEDVVDRVVAGLRSGALDAEAARELVREAGLDEFVRVAESRDAVVDAFGRFYDVGLEFWSFNADVEDPGPGVVRAMFTDRRRFT